MVAVYLEGAAPGKAARAQAREGFKKLMARCGCTANKFRFEPCGDRKAAYDAFVHSLATNEEATHSMLLVDSEDAVTTQHTASLAGGWQLLEAREPWGLRPPGTADHQCQLMATCMETWIMVDRGTLQRLFPQCLRRNTLFPVHQLEQRQRHAVHDTLELATSDCGKDRGYKKGRKSFDMVAQLEPAALRQLPHFVKFETALKAAITAHP